MIYRFISEHTEYPVVKWAAYFEVSTSGYYKWQTEREHRTQRDENERNRIRKIFKESNGSYGAERICGNLRKDGYTASFKRVKRMMNLDGLHSVHQHQSRSLTNSRKSRGDEYPNLLRGTKPVVPFQALSSDISYIPRAYA